MKWRLTTTLLLLKPQVRKTKEKGELDLISKVEVYLRKSSLLAPTREFDRVAMLEAKDLECCCPLDNGHHEGQEPSASPSIRHSPTRTPPAGTSRHRSQESDSITVCQWLSRIFRKTIDSIKGYADIITYALTSFRAALLINLSSWISCRQLYNTMSSGMRRMSSFWTLFIPTLVQSCLLYLPPWRSAISSYGAEMPKRPSSLVLNR